MSKEIGDINKEFWDKRAAETDFYSAGSPIKRNDITSVIRQKYRNRTEFNHIRRVINLKGKTLLDLGCGTGRLSFEFAKYCKQVVGFDFSEQMIKKAKDHANNLGVKNVRFEVGDITHFNTDIKFDIVFFGGVLMCIPDENLQGVFDSITPLMHRNSVVINRDTLSLNETFTTEKISDRPDFAIYRTKEEYMKIFEDSFTTYYCRETFPLVVATNLYRRLPTKVQSYKITLAFLNFGLWIQSELLDPLMIKFPTLYKNQIDKWKKSDYGRRQFFFFHKLRNA